MLDTRSGVRSASPAAVPFARPAAGPPVFITGCNRGGTTILTRLLSAHPELALVGRGPFDEGQFVWRKRFPDWSRHRWAVPPWRWFLRRSADHARPQLLEFFRREFARAMPSPGRMLEKTPANAVRIPFIDRLYPDCCFVHLVRDGRHTSASLMARRVLWAYAPHQWVGAHRTALADLARLQPERVTVVRYEDLLRDPAPVLEEVCRRCGLSWRSSEQSAVLRRASAAIRTPDSRWDRLPAWKRRYVIRVVGELQRELGYEVDG